MTTYGLAGNFAPAAALRSPAGDINRIEAETGFAPKSRPHVSGWM